MNRRYLLIGLVALVGLPSLKAALSESPSPAVLHAAETQTNRSATFDFEREGLPVPRWKLELQADGSGTYAELGSTSAQSAAQPVHIGAAIRAKLAAAYPAVQAGKCETKLKNIAKTGTKTLAYRGAGETATCTFNYSDNEALNIVSDALLAVAATMQAGERIAQKHRYDRLGLDAELDVLTDEVKSGRALEVANIAPILESVASDERVMERAQRKAARLLQDAGVTSADSSR